jgi:hypothetical protein
MAVHSAVEITIHIKIKHGISLNSICVLNAIDFQLLFMNILQFVLAVGQQLGHSFCPKDIRNYQLLSSTCLVFLVALKTSGVSFKTLRATLKTLSIAFKILKANRNIKQINAGSPFALKANWPLRLPPQCIAVGLKLRYFEKFENYENSEAIRPEANVPAAKLGLF